jgi:hypothetical protein
MRDLTGHFIIAVLTFIIGVGAASVWLYRRPHQSIATLENLTTTRTPEPWVGPPAEKQEQPKEESPEAKAIRLAEEFIARNGYTDLPPARDHLSYETVERASSIDELLERRRNTLERNAYGVVERGRLGTKGGWTVVFRHRLRSGDERDVLGRAVTMDRDFKNLLVEHKPFPLANVDKRL